MNQNDFPPFPSMDERGPHVCTTIQFYLAIMDDLPSEQARILSTHVQGCKTCAAELRILQRTTSLITSLPQSTPSAHIDKAILATVQNWHSEHHPRTSTQLQQKNRTAAHPFPPVPTKKSKPTIWPRLAVLAATFLLLVLAGTFLHAWLFPANTTSTFQIPANLSWSGYVLHYTETKTDMQGKDYQVEVYQDLGTNQMHIESTMPDQFDVVVVTDDSTVLGEDMMHHVAEMGSGVEPWMVDGSIFDLDDLRQDLATQRATYLGKGTFQSQEVYQVRTSNHEVLLLNMHYLPVAVLSNFTGSGTGIEIYNTYQLTPAVQVSDTMWDMQVPSNFRMGTLPSRP